MINKEDVSLFQKFKAGDPAISHFRVKQRTQQSVTSQELV